MPSEATELRFAVVPSRSAVVIEARSNVGPIMFGASGIAGEIVAPFDAGAVGGPGAAAHLEVRVDELASGNDLYDSELRRRIEARRYPRSSVTLRSTEPTSTPECFDVTGDIVFHGVSRTLAGQVTVALQDGSRLVVVGEQHLDVREFEMSMPTMLMIKIDPVVRVRLHVEADLVTDLPNGQD